MEEKLISVKKRKVLDQLKREARGLKLDAIATILSDTDHKAFRLFWFSMLLISASACVVLVVKSIEEFARYEVTTKMRLLTDQEAVFPVITICSFNPFTTPYADALFAEAGVVNSLSNMWLLDTYMQNKTGERLSDAQRKRMSDLNDLLVSCSFSFQTCSVDDFQRIFHPLFGNCYRFNSGLNESNATDQAMPLTKIMLGGSIYSFSLDLYAGLTESQLIANMSFPKGIILYLVKYYFLIFRSC